MEKLIGSFWICLSRFVVGKLRLTCLGDSLFKTLGFGVLGRSVRFGRSVGTASMEAYSCRYD